ncbi:urease accessory protein UreH domain-containing protein [Angustibacter luteus]|uniref:Sulfite exporter TauE/SafE family protein n=1 Tax=Angustibacter luteus TaxID=658456 RepID=A0ABW1JFG0_9ACTN
MLSSISPLGERARGARWGLTVTAYLVGSLVGGAVAGTLAAALGSALPASWRDSVAAAVLVAIGVLVGLALDLRARGHGLPSWKRQVDEAWLTRYRGWVYGLGFGLQLGAGVMTIVTSSTVYAVLLLAAWSGQLWVGLLLGLVFGVARGLPILALHGVHSPGDLHRFFARLDRWARPVDRLARGALVLTATVVVASGWS